MAERDDNDILKDFGNPALSNAAFNEIIQKYKVRLYWHVRKMVIDHDDTDDILQNAFIKIWKGLPNFQGDSKLFTWLYRIATNECLTFLKNKNKRFFVQVDDSNNDFTAKLESDPYFDGDKAQIKLQQAIHQLPDKQKLVFNMRYFEEMSYEDISAALGTSEGALKASYHFAVKKIEEFLKTD
ncbi:MAG: RNA polymerase sigma factor [Bacteroidia bacterium]|nr:RNA polymerase sigma factor [Bacteroidia bacterium]